MILYDILEWGTVVFILYIELFRYNHNKYDLIPQFVLHDSRVTVHYISLQNFTHDGDSDQHFIFLL